MYANKLTITETLKEYKFLLIKMAKKWSDSTGIELEECIQTALLAYVKAYNGFDSSVGTKFSTYLYHVVTNTLRSAAKQHFMHSTKDSEALKYEQAKVDGLQALLRDISKDAKLMVLAIVDMPDSSCQMIKKLRSRKNMQNVVREYLKSIGWAEDQVNTCFKEIAEAIAWS